MTITSVGYPAADPNNPQPGDFVDASKWGALAALIGVKHAIARSADLVVTTVSGVDRGVSVSAGTAFAGGVMSTSDAPTGLQHDTVASGSRYDVVAMRFAWGTTRATSFGIIKGGSTNSVPGLTFNPGVSYDVPLWLVRVDAGSTAVTLVDDLRLFKAAGYASDSLRGRDVGPNDHHTTVRLKNGELWEFRAGTGWVGLSKPGYLWDATYGWMPLSICESCIAPVGGSNDPGGAASGTVVVPLAKTYRGSERYAWDAGNGDVVAQNELTVRGVVSPSSGDINKITVSYTGAKGKNARFTVTGTLKSDLLS